MGSAAVEGTTLHYEEEGRGRPLLFIHGVAGGIYTWSDLVARLRDRFRCVVYDRRGNNGSPAGEPPRPMGEQHAFDAVALMDALGIDSAVLVGSSNGAHIALDVARRFPTRILGTVVSEPPLYAFDPGAADAFRAAIKEALGRGKAAGGAEGAVEAFFETVAPSFWRALPENRRAQLRANHQGFYADLRMPPPELSREGLSGITRPCLVISGSQSWPIFRNVARVLAGEMPGFRHLEFEGSGHLSPFEQPDRFASTVADFVATLSNSE